MFPSFKFWRIIFPLKCVYDQKILWVFKNHDHLESCCFCFNGDAAAAAYIYFSTKCCKMPLGGLLKKNDLAGGENFFPQLKLSWVQGRRKKVSLKKYLVQVSWMSAVVGHRTAVWTKIGLILSATTHLNSTAKTAYCLLSLCGEISSTLLLLQLGLVKTIGDAELEMDSSLAFFRQWCGRDWTLSTCL